MKVKTVKIEISFEVGMKDEDVNANSSNEEMAKWFEEWLYEEYKDMNNVDNIKVKADIVDKV